MDNATLAHLRALVHAGERFEAVELLTHDDCVSEGLDSIAAAYIKHHKPEWSESVRLWLCVQYWAHGDRRHEVTLDKAQWKKDRFVVQTRHEVALQLYDDHKGMECPKMADLARNIWAVARGGLGTLIRRTSDALMTMALATANASGSEEDGFSIMAQAFTLRAVGTALTHKQLTNNTRASQKLVDAQRRLDDFLRMSAQEESS